MTLTVEPVGPDQAATVHALVAAAFATRPQLDPPADALAETVGSIAEMLAPAGGLVARIDGEPVGTLIFDPDGDTMFLRRFGVLAEHRHHGVAHQLVTAAVLRCLGYRDLAVLARQELPATIGFWREAGFSESARKAPYVELRRPPGQPVTLPGAGDMKAFGTRLGEVLEPGDLVVLTGPLGAGKTTLTQGLAAGLGVRGGVTSPTFVIARVHPSLSDGPALVHADAYRLGGLAELDDLDLDADVDRAVTVVEWGAGLAETLADSRLDVVIERHGRPGAGEEADETRTVTVTGSGPRWPGRAG